MNVVETQLPGVLMIEPKVFGDHRGFFKETFHIERYGKQASIWPLCRTIIRAQRGVRGLHLQRSRPQGKLVAARWVFDAAVDVIQAQDVWQLCRRRAQR